jgi:L-asparaginase II
MTPSSPYQPIYEITRGRVVESIHYGSIAVTDNQGHLVAWYGNPETTTYLRSSAKPFQVMPFIEFGGQAAYDLSPREIAIMCASHSGTDEHVELVRSIQAKTGVNEEDLMCGVHTPYHAQTAEAMRQRGEKPTPNRHNCSGKHTGMLAYIRLKQSKNDEANWDKDNRPYIDPQHGLQQEILKNFAFMCDLTPTQVEIGIDGCSLPNFAVPLQNAAHALARLSDPEGLPATKAAACRTIFKAMTSHPDMVGGPDSFDTKIMLATGGRILCKGGAEGYQALSLLPGSAPDHSQALGICLKISDGDLSGHSRAKTDPFGHARPAVTLEVLRQLGAITKDETEKLASYGPTFPIHNWRKLVVGEARPCFALNFDV